MDPVLLAANDGGHVMELLALAPRIAPRDERQWFVPDTQQCRSLLKDERVHWAKRAPTRDLKAAAANARLAGRLLASRRFRLVASTGSSLAVSTLPVSAAHGIPSAYIESATRVTGPSLSGRILHTWPSIKTFSQYSDWGNRGWRHSGSVFDGFATESDGHVTNIHSVVVSLGTSPRYGFRRLVEQLLTVIPRNARVLWQTGATDLTGLPVEGNERMSSEALESAMAQADVVVTHAGVGSALTALRVGKVPLLIPRRKVYGEHVDDHQVQLSRVLADRGLAIVSDVNNLDLASFQRAASLRSMSIVDDLPTLDLA